MNVLMNEYKENPKRRPAAPSYNNEVRAEINDNVKSEDKRLFKSRRF